MNTPEQLTEEEREARVQDSGGIAEKTLRIIEAHAADRAALVARVRELEYANGQRRLVIDAIEDARDE